MPPIEPPATLWVFPPVTSADKHGLLGLGADLEPGTLLHAYRSGIFPMPVDRNGPMGWWSPNPRGIIPLDGLHVSRSLRRSARRFEIRIDTAFADVVNECADDRRPHGWISAAIKDAYLTLHRLGWAHSIEAWSIDGDAPTLAGGLYGVAIGGLFAGESMFHRRTDASKVALHALVDCLRDDGHGGEGRLLDVQWCTDHLASLGAIEVPSSRYLELLKVALDVPPPAAFS